LDFFGYVQQGFSKKALQPWKITSCVAKSFRQNTFFCTVYAILIITRHDIATGNTFSQDY